MNEMDNYERLEWKHNVEVLGMEIQGIASLVLAFGEQFEPSSTGMLNPNDMCAALSSMSKHLSRIGTDLVNISMNRL